jgi:hypothetical protein
MNGNKIIDARFGQAAHQLRRQTYSGWRLRLQDHAFDALHDINGAPMMDCHRNKAKTRTFEYTLIKAVRILYSRAMSCAVLILHWWGRRKTNSRSPNCKNRLDLSSRWEIVGRVMHRVIPAFDF